MTRISDKPLWKPKYWNELSRAQKQSAYNGIGAEYFPAWFRRLLDMAFFWLGDAAYIHDVEYTYSTFRPLADFRFLVNAAILAGLDLTRQAFGIAAFIILIFGGGRAWRESRLKESSKDD